VSEKSKDADLKTVTFDETPIMSTYLLAFVVGEFDYVEDKTSNGVVVRVYTPLGKSEQGLFALQVAVKSLPFYDGTWRSRRAYNQCVIDSYTVVSSQTTSAFPTLCPSPT
jgi:aminopeptidase N